MSKSSAPPKLIDRTAAWSSVVANVACPGLGSIAVGRRSGYLQLGLAVVGVVLTGAAVPPLLMKLIQLQAWPTTWDELRLLVKLWRHLWLMFAGGFALFLLGWLWSLALSLALVWRLRRGDPALPRGGLR